MASQDMKIYCYPYIIAIKRVDVSFVSWNYVQDHTITDIPTHKVTKSQALNHSHPLHEDYSNQIVSLFHKEKATFGRPEGGLRPVQGI